eukprot:6799754-Prorocentrum_lima.AAC.1
MECNKEHLYRLSDEKVLVKLCADFEHDWEKSEIVTPEMVDIMMTKHRGRNRSQSEGSNDRATGGNQTEELHRQVSLNRDLTS